MASAATPISDEDKALIRELNAERIKRNLLAKQLTVKKIAEKLDLDETRVWNFIRHDPLLDYAGEAANDEVY